MDVYDRGFDSGTHRVAFEEEADDQQYTIGSRNKTKPGAKPVRYRLYRVVIRSLLQLDSAAIPCY